MNSVTENLFDDKVAQVLADVAKNNGFTNYEIKKLPGTVKGDGYLGIISRAKITDKQDNSKVLDLIIKSASKSEELRNLMEIGEIYKREAFVYNMVLTTFQKLEIEKGLPTQEFGPLLYDYLKEDKFETLVMQDLKSINYKLYERRIPMTKDHVRLVLTQYGRFHALSVGLHDQKPEKWKTLTVTLDDAMLSNMAETGFIQTLVQQCTKAKKVFDEDSTGLERYNQFVEEIQPFLEGLINYVDEHSVILHGDCWTNNMMFKYEDKTNPTKPTSVRFLDYQVSRLGSPVIDLSYFFYACCPKEALDDLEDYLQVYYKSFSNYLRQLGSDPDKLFPYTVLEEHWKKFSKYGLLMAILVIHVMLTEPEEAIDMAEVSETGSDFSNMFGYEIQKSDQYYERVKPIIRHFIEKGFM